MTQTHDSDPPWSRTSGTLFPLPFEVATIFGASIPSTPILVEPMHRMLRSARPVVVFATLIAPFAGAPRAAAQAADPIETVSTRAAGIAGASVDTAGVDPKLLDQWTALLEARRGRELAGALRERLRAGDPGLVELHAFLRRLDADPRTALLLITDYNVSFALMHVAMLERDAVARLAHFELATTTTTPDAPSRRLLYGYVPLFVRYHAGRYPELRAALAHDLDERLTRADLDLGILFAALNELRYFPDLTRVAERLHGATELGDATFVLEHLAVRDDHDAVRVILGYLSREESFTKPACRVALRALAQMRHDDAQRAVAQLLEGRDKTSVTPMVEAYFSLARGPEDAWVARRYLDSPTVPAAEKTAVLRALSTASRPVFDALATRHLAELRDPAMRAAVEALRASRQSPVAAPSPAGGADQSPNTPPESPPSVDRK